MIELVLLVVGAILGLLLDRCLSGISKRLKRRNPLSIEARRAYVAPLWFATDRELPTVIEETSEFENLVMKQDPFCGFGKIDINVKNDSEDVLYITNIVINKKQIDWSYSTRVFFMNQGGLSPLRLNAVLDDDKVVLAENLQTRHSFRGDYFANGNRVKVLPGEVELIRLGFITVTNAWEFNCDMHYTINGSQRVAKSVLERNEVIVPYLPEVYNRDFNSLIEFSGSPKYSQFDNAIFTEEMRKADPERQHLPYSSSIEYLSNLI